MAGPPFLSLVEQVADYLREEIIRMRWSDTIPGVHRIAAEIEVNSKTVELALRQLETEGIVVSRGAGRRRRIVLSRAGKAKSSMRVAIQPYDDSDSATQSMLDLQHELARAGHRAFFAPRTLINLGMDPHRVARQVGRIEADAWVVSCGSRKVLEWFAEQPVPAIALFGQRVGIKIAGVGPDWPPAYAAATRHLIALGHRRIVLITDRVWRLPEPADSEQAFLQELREHGIPTGDYNLPDWEENREGIQRLFDSLFSVTPPTALIIDEVPLFIATMQFLGNRGIRIPEDVSLVCNGAIEPFEWCDPSVAHIGWDAHRVVQRVSRWVVNVSRGHVDLRQTRTPATFVPNGTVGPAAKD